MIPSKSFSDYSGYTCSVEDAFSVIRKFEVATHSQFVLTRESKNFGKEDIPKENKKNMFDLIRRTTHLMI